MLADQLEFTSARAAAPQHHQGQSAIDAPGHKYEFRA